MIVHATAVLGGFGTIWTKRTLYFPRETFFKKTWNFSKKAIDKWGNIWYNIYVKLLKGVFEYENQKYTLEYTRESIALMEKQGFLAEDIVAKPMLMLPLAFEGLFYKNHRNINKPKIDEIFDLFKDKSKLINTIIKMLDERSVIND